jgi:hypothetical protein
MSARDDGGGGSGSGSSEIVATAAAAAAVVRADDTEMDARAEALVYEYFGRATANAVAEDTRRVLAAPTQVRVAIVEQLVAEHRFGCTSFECTLCAQLDWAALDEQHYADVECEACHGRTL